MASGFQKLTGYLRNVFGVDASGGTINGIQHVKEIVAGSGITAAVNEATRTLTLGASVPARTSASYNCISGENYLDPHGPTDYLVTNNVAGNLVEIYVQTSHLSAGDVVTVRVIAAQGTSTDILQESATGEDIGSIAGLAVSADRTFWVKFTGTELVRLNSASDLIVDGRPVQRIATDSTITVTHSGSGFDRLATLSAAPSISLNSTPVTEILTGPGTSVSIVSGVATLSTASRAFRDALPSTALQNALLAGFDASSLDHLKDGTALSAVSSVFGGRYPITQHVSGNMPTVKLGRNGKKSINFNSVNQQRLLINGLEAFASASTYTTPITIVMRIKRGLMTGFRNIFSLCDTATTRDASFYIPADVYRLAAYQAGVTLSYSGSRLLPYTGGNTFTIAVTFNGASSVLRYGQSEVTGALGTAVATAFSSCEIGGFSRGNDPTAHWDGDVEAIAVFAGALTSEQCNQVEDTFLRDRKWRLIVDGNSHCEGQSDQTSQMSGEIEALLGPYFSVEQQGLGGQPISAMVTNFGTNIAPRLRGSNKIIFAWEICNAIYQGQTYAQITASLAAYKALCDVQGAKLAIATCMPWKAWTVGSAGYNLMNQVNAEILAHPTLYCSAPDAVANLTRLSILADPNNTTYYKDDNHLKSAANVVVASEIERAIKSACLA